MVKTGAGEVADVRGRDVGELWATHPERGVARSATAETTP